MSDPQVVYIKDLRPGMHIRPNLEVVVGRVVSKPPRRKSETGYRYSTVILADDTGVIDLGIFEEFFHYYDSLKLDHAYWFTGLWVKERTTTKNATGLEHPAQLTTWSSRTLMGEITVQPFDLYAFKPTYIKDILEEPYGKAVDVIGICNYVGSVEHKLQLATGIPFLLRKFILEDETGEVTVALFEDEAVNFSENNEGRIIAMKGAVMTDWGPGRSPSLKATGTSRLHLNPLNERAMDLADWYPTRMNDEEADFAIDYV